MYQPRKKFTTPLLYYELDRKERVKGTVVKIYKEKPELIWGSFTTYGGTEIESNRILVIEDTAKVETWYDPKITSEGKIQVAGSERSYEIIGEPEDIEERHKFLQMKVKRIKGGR